MPVSGTLDFLIKWCFMDLSNMKPKWNPRFYLMDPTPKGSIRCQNFRQFHSHLYNQLKGALFLALIGLLTSIYVIFSLTCSNRFIKVLTVLHASVQSDKHSSGQTFTLSLVVP